ncbi:MAG: ATP-binding protein [Chloroflexota bacterium]|nr:ATP-binding protein [Chloroflexota bacterium]
MAHERHTGRRQAHYSRAGYTLGAADPGDRPRIFEPYSRTGKTPAADRRGSWSGTGLGLAIAKSIVELHRGRIWVEQTSEKGISFCFSLPQTNGLPRR